MNDPEKLVDLPPHQWVSEREKPKEPIFGPGFPYFVALVISIFAAAFLKEYGWIGAVSAAAIGAILSGIVYAIYDPR